LELESLSTDEAGQFTFQQGISLKSVPTPA
jgi:hypothetical protein